MLTQNPKLLRIVVTLENENSVPPVLKQFSTTLDETAPLKGPRDISGEGSFLACEDLENRSLDDFIAKAEQEMVFVIAWYEKKEVTKKRKTKVYHNLIYIWADSEAKCNVHFRGVRPKIRQERNDFLKGKKFTVRTLWDNQNVDKDGKPIEGRRWELSVRDCQDVGANETPIQLPFQGADVPEAA